MRLALATLVLIASSAVASAILSFGLRRIAVRFGLVDHPGPRKLQSAPVPLLGGAAVFLSWILFVALGCLLIELGNRRWSFVPAGILSPGLVDLFDAVRPSGATYRHLMAVVGGAALVFIIGLWDDVVGSTFPVIAKVAAQVAAALILVAGGVRTEVLPGDLLNVALTVAWVLVVTNAFNLLDNMDGLVTGVSVIAGSLLLAVAVSQGQILVAAVLALLVGGSLGFLPYNFPTARMYLGDAGSQVLGFLFAGLSLLESYVAVDGPGLMPVVLPVLVVAVPLFDTLAVVAYRLRRGAPILRGDTNHVSHRLVRLGVTRGRAVVFHWLLTLSCGAPACLLPWLPPAGAILVLGQAGVTLLIVWLFLGGADDSA